MSPDDAKALRGVGGCEWHVAANQWAKGCPACLNLLLVAARNLVTIPPIDVYHPLTYTVGVGNEPDQPKESQMPRPRRTTMTPVSPRVIWADAVAESERIVAETQDPAEVKELAHRRAMLKLAEDLGC